MIAYIWQTHDFAQLKVMLPLTHPADLNFPTTPNVGFEALEEFVEVFPKKAPESIDMAIVVYLLREMTNEQSHQTPYHTCATVFLDSRLMCILMHILSEVHNQYYLHYEAG